MPAQPVYKQFSVGTPTPSSRWEGARGAYQKLGEHWEGVELGGPRESGEGSFWGLEFLSICPWRKGPVCSACAHVFSPCAYVHVFVHTRARVCVCTCMCVCVECVALVEPGLGCGRLEWWRGLSWTQGIRPQKRKSITEELCWDSYRAGKSTTRHGLRLPDGEQKPRGLVLWPVGWAVAHVRYGFPRK